MANQPKYKVVIVGGGTAGITVAAQLAKRISASDIAIIDPASNHYYQPLWTLVGAGIVPKEVTRRSEASLIPNGVQYIQDAVESFEPEKQNVVTRKGSQISYDYLVVCPGLQLDWNKVKGLQESIGKNGVVSNYAYEYVESTWQALKHFKGGNAVFTQPNTPIKCGGAPQKIVYLADDVLRERGVRDKTNIMFFHAGKSIFGVERYAKTLRQVIERKKIDVHFQMNLVEIRGDQKEAVFEHLETKETQVVSYEMIHVTPPMSAPDFIKKSPLTNEAGWIEVDKFTLQHTRHENIFALGDAAGLPTSKTGAAIRKQAPVVVANLLSLMQNKPLTAKYDGYTSCPLVTGKGKLVLAEFDYNNNPRETFPFDQSKERISMYLLKKHMLPMFYWHGMLKGRM
ncbi:NAD(P)/FAD-dependent oxidoreductase [Ferviditalea candida]|uniref:FAD/NAD(P)-binding oxidoreductase n=1 Tax=Ferviditalea candida TaxID=3108399 RepID=A0ABU5ZGN5_9BACL|nr:FAD/NAD(P)-binding oxidoreductase [Paenibacillaceae bacterium T2]